VTNDDKLIRVPRSYNELKKIAALKYVQLLRGYFRRRVKRGTLLVYLLFACKCEHKEKKRDIIFK